MQTKTKTQTQTAAKPATTEYTCPSGSGYVPVPVGNGYGVAGSPSTGRGVNGHANKLARKAPHFSGSCIVVPLVSGNPKRSGTNAAGIYDAALAVLGTPEKPTYITVAQLAAATDAACKAVGYTPRQDLNYNVAARFWAVLPPADSPLGQALTAAGHKLAGPPKGHKSVDPEAQPAPKRVPIRKRSRD